MNDNFSQGTDPEMTDVQLDRLLDELETPPAPSDLLRARLHAEPSRAHPQDATARRRPRAVPDAPARGRFSPGKALYGRIAAVLCLAALVGMAAWLPAPGPVRSAAVVRLAAPVVSPAASASQGWDVAGTESGAESYDAGPALSLVGDGGTAINGVGLVQAAWSGSAGADSDDGGELDSIPLD